jgi:hypothetical protein
LDFGRSAIWNLGSHSPSYYCLNISGYSLARVAQLCLLNSGFSFIFDLMEGDGGKLIRIFFFLNHFQLPHTLVRFTVLRFATLSDNWASLGLDKGTFTELLDLLFQLERALVKHLNLAQSYSKRN